MPKIKLALAGQMRSGKGSSIEYLEDKYKTKTFNFGDELKRYAHMIYYNIPKEPKPRKLYQFMNVLREFDNNVYVNLLEKNYLEWSESSFSNDVDIIIIGDIRQQNELDWCKKNGFITIKVLADYEVREKRAIESNETFNKEIANHPSESVIEKLKTDYTIYNNTTLDYLYKEVEKIINKSGSNTNVEITTESAESINTLEIYTDGGARGNGKEDSVSAWAYVFYHNNVDNELFNKKEVSIGNTNSEMEIKAINESLKNLFSMIDKLKDKIDSINIYSDSAYCINAINEGWLSSWSNNDWTRGKKKEELKNKELWQSIHSLLNVLSDKIEINFHKVKGHSGNKGNERADELVNKAMDNYTKENEL